MNAPMRPDEHKMPEAVSATELRNDMRRILETVHYFGRRYMIVRDGNPIAVVLGLEDYRRLIGAPGPAAAIDRA